MYGRAHLPESCNMKIKIINLYYFSLIETDTIYLRKINLLLKNIRDYLHEEWISIKTSKSGVRHYDVREFHLEEVGSLLFFQKRKNAPEDITYFPEMYCEISVQSQHLSETEKLRKLIFLLSNIFEAFDHFDEKYVFIEYHSEIEKLKTKYDIYELRHNFQNINNLEKSYRVERIQQNLEKYLGNTDNTRSLRNIKTSSPDIYLSLLFFTYLIFSLQKNLIRIQTELQSIIEIEITPTSLTSSLRLTQTRLTKQKNLIEENLEKLTWVYEKFIRIFKK